MDLVDFALRCAAICLLAVIAVVLLRAPIDRDSKGAVVLVAVSTIALLLFKSLMPLGLPDWAMANLALIGALEPLAITWLILAIFLDRPRYFWLWMTSGSLASATFFAHLQLGLPPLYCAPISGLHHLALLVLALASARDDLDSNRCSCRPYFAVAIAGLAIGMVGLEAFNADGQHTTLAALSQSVGTLAIVAAFAVWMLQANMQRWPGRVEAREVAHATAASEEVDTGLLQSLDAAMREGVWREEGLSIGALAQRLNVPEHRLRRAINQGLGHRNFSSFINAARIKAAKAELRDPIKANRTVLEIAYNVGFASLGPFNRAFRAETGQSPTEYRRDAPHDASLATETGDAPSATETAEPQKSSPIAGNLH